MTMATMGRFMKNLDITFMFEMVSMKNAHVVNYQEEDEGLYLTGARNVYTGHQYGYNALEELAKRDSIAR